MRLWLVCCALLFIAAQGYDWVIGQIGDLPELSMPWIILGGLGLAIASNLSTFKIPSSSPPKTVNKPPVDPQPMLSEGTGPPVPSAIAPPVAQSLPKSGSISFEMPKKSPRSAPKPFSPHR